MTDPEREQKLQAWSLNTGPASFNEVFEKNRRIALLALPGDGKSLLLNRLAVAYSDPERRQLGNDNLPDMDLLPILIRCREWRPYIQEPIGAILSRIPAMTGLSSLNGLKEALLPLFESGRTLLLVDGLDQIHNDAERAIFVEHLESFMDQYASSRLVVTSREAGFALVAPSLTRFCSQWRIAPLDVPAITMLCSHWNALMGGVSPGAIEETEEFVRQLQRNPPIMRLAENPLLLTMLLAIKHGAGRLPRDRVTLYKKAIEVLLTWNIKGHDPLDLMEAVPQLASVAFEFMKEGKQTATGGEIIRILETARDNIEQVGRYAKGTPNEFLKRVELRSSLVVEAGHQLDGVTKVPFYQFRHLTFQEYLAALAIVQGHYLEYERGHTIVSPIESSLLLPKWEEVIPMASALAKKRAEPLLEALIAAAEPYKPMLDKFELQPVPIPVERLLDCLLEGVEATAATLVKALELLALFGNRFGLMLKGSRFASLASGPFANDLVEATLSLYLPMNWPPGSFLIGFLAELAERKLSEEFWCDPIKIEQLSEDLHSSDKRKVIVSALVCARLGTRMSLQRQSSEDCRRAIVGVLEPLIIRLEELILDEDPAVYFPAIWAWQNFREGADRNAMPSSSILDRLLKIWLSDTTSIFKSSAFRVFDSLRELRRSEWQPTLSPEQLTAVREIIQADKAPDDGPFNLRNSALVIASFF